MDDALRSAVERDIGHAEVCDIGFQRTDLDAAFLIGDREISVFGWHIVVSHSDRVFRTTYVAPGRSQAREGLGTRHLVHEMAVDVEQPIVAIERSYAVGVPNLLNHCSRFATHWTGPFFKHALAAIALRKRPPARPPGRATRKE